MVRLAANLGTPFSPSSRAPTSGRALESRRELLRAPNQNSHIGADGREQAAEIDITARQRLVAGQDARDVAARPDPADSRLDHRLHLRVGGIAEIAERGRK